MLRSNNTGHTQGAHTYAIIEVTSAIPAGNGIWEYFNMVWCLLFSLKGKALTYLASYDVQMLRRLIGAEETGIIRLQIMREAATRSPISMSLILSNHEPHNYIVYLILRTRSTFLRPYKTLYKVRHLSRYISSDAPCQRRHSTPRLLHAPLSIYK